MRTVATARKRELMLERALDVFVTHGYVGTSTEQLAAAASVSKQTLYKEFGDKEGVFAALIEFACDRVDDPFAPMVEEMGRVSSAAEGIGLVAAQLARSVMTPQVQRLRRLVLAEAVRFPELGLLYWERGFLRVLDSIARCLQILDRRALLTVPDADLAAHHLAGMLLWIPSNRTMFAAGAHPVEEDELDRVVATGVDAFLRAYRRAGAGAPSA